MFCSSGKRTSGGVTIGTTLTAVHHFVPRDVHFCWQYASASSAFCPIEFRALEPDGGIARHMRNFSVPHCALEWLYGLYDVYWQWSVRTYGTAPPDW